MGALQDIEEQENERYRNVLNRKKQNEEIYEGRGNKRTRDEDNEDSFNGLFDGERKGKNKFSQKRNKKNKKRR